MSTTKTFAIAGVSTRNGVTKVRFANDMMRVKILAKGGFTDIDLIELPREMTKGEIAAYMTEVGFGKDKPEVQAAIAYIAKKNPAAKNAGSNATVAKTAVAA
jgi:hypothetical protein